MAYISTSLTVKGIAILTNAAQDAYRNNSDRAIYDAPKIKAEIDSAGQIALDRRDSSDSRKRRWAIAYRTACAVFGLPLDAVWIPCYKCGRLADAWTLDADHVNADGNSNPGNLMLMCASCNTHGKASLPVHPNAEAVILEAGQGTGYVCGGKGIRSMWSARPRRQAGGNFEGTRYL